MNTPQTEPAPSPEFIYKVAPRATWEAALPSGRFEGVAVDFADGFIHFSDATQLAETLSRHFAGQADLLLIAVRTAALGEALRWDVSRGGALFPHLYAPLDLSAVAWTAPIDVSASGDCVLPEAVR